MIVFQPIIGTGLGVVVDVEIEPFGGRESDSQELVVLVGGIGFIYAWLLLLCIVLSLERGLVIFVCFLFHNFLKIFPLLSTRNPTPHPNAILIHLSPSTLISLAQLLTFILIYFLNPHLVLRNFAH